MKRTLLGLVLVAAVATPALAQPGKPKEKAEKVRVLTMGEEKVTGGRPGHDGFTVGIKEAAQSTSLIRIRRDFIDLIHKSVEAL